MAYPTAADLVTRYGDDLVTSLSDRADEPTGTYDEAVVAAAIEAADAEVDGYLAGRYVLPLSSTPVLVKRISEALAIWHLHVTEPDKQISEGHKVAQQQLRDIADGRIVLQVDGVQPDTTTSGQAQVTDRARPFEAAKMTGFI